MHTADPLIAATDNLALAVLPAQSKAVRTLERLIDTTTDRALLHKFTPILLRYRLPSRFSSTAPNASAAKPNTIDTQLTRAITQLETFGALDHAGNAASTRSESAQPPAIPPRYAR